MKRIRLTPILIHIYTFITIVSMLFAPLGANNPLLDLGASSGFIGLALSGSDTVSWFISALLLLWCITSPIALIVFYILSYKRIYIPFAFFAAIDAAIVLAWVTYCFVTNDMYAFDACITDAIVSTLFSAALITFLCIERRRKVSATTEEGSKITDLSLTLELPTKQERTSELLQHPNNHF